MHILSIGFVFNNPIDIFLSLLGIIAIVASAVAVGRSALLKTQLEALRGDRDDLTDRVERLEHEKEILERDLREEKNRREALERVVTAQDDIRKLSRDLERHHEVALRIDANVTAIKRKVSTT